MTSHSHKKRATPAHRRKAPEITAEYLTAAVAAIDAEFGEGYAKDNPELVAAMLQATVIQCGLDQGRAVAYEVSDELRATLLSLKPRLF